MENRKKPATMADVMAENRRFLLGANAPSVPLRPKKSPPGLIAVEEITASNLFKYAADLEKCMGVKENALRDLFFVKNNGAAVTNTLIYSAEVTNALIADLDLSAVFKLHALKTNVAHAMMGAAYYAADNFDNFKSNPSYQVKYFQLFGGIATLKPIENGYVVLEMDYQKTTAEFYAEGLQQIQKSINERLDNGKAMSETMLTGGYLRSHLDNINRDSGILNGFSNDTLSRRIVMEGYHFEFTPESVEVEKNTALAQEKFAFLQNKLAEDAAFLTDYRRGKLQAVKEGKDFAPEPVAVMDVKAGTQKRKLFSGCPNLFKRKSKDSDTAAAPAPAVEEVKGPKA
jgi:hypothetical protein